MSKRENEFRIHGDIREILPELSHKPYWDSNLQDGGHQHPLQEMGTRQCWAWCWWAPRGSPRSDIQTRDTAAKSSVVCRKLFPWSSFSCFPSSTLNCYGVPTKGKYFLGTLMETSEELRMRETTALWFRVDLVPHVSSKIWGSSDFSPWPRKTRGSIKDREQRPC